MASSLSLPFRCASAFLILAFSSLFFDCIPPSTPQPQICRYHHECGDDSRCIFPNNACYIELGTCDGTCKKDVIPDTSCACKQDEDCNYPYEGCGNCQCYKRDIQTCTKDADCGQGMLCTGSNPKLCEPRKTCTLASDCLPSYRCEKQTCCNPAAGACSPSTSCLGQPCTNDLTCSSCQMRCLQGTCQASTSCLGSSCSSNADCSACGSRCQNGICRSSSGCTSISCSSNEDCQAAGRFSCVSGCCN